MHRLDRLDAPANARAHLVGNRQAVVTLVGAVDSAARPAVEQALGEALDSDIDELVVDLSETTLVDSVALGALIYAAKRLTGRGGEMRFAGANASVAGVFELTGLNRVFRVDPAA